MRKRIAALVLCLCLTAAGAACEELGIDPRAVPDDGPPSADYYVTIDPQTGERIEEEDAFPYLFLDIPFGTELLDIKELAKEKAGLDLVRTEETILRAKDQAIKVNGHDADIEFHLGENKCLKEIRIRYLPVSGLNRREVIEESTTVYADVVYALGDKYGRVQRGDFEVYEDDGRVDYRCPFVDNIEDNDFDTIKSAIMKNDSVNVTCMWRNVWALLMTSVTRSGEHRSQVTIVYRNNGRDDVELGEELPVYEEKYQVDLQL